MKTRIGDRLWKNVLTTDKHQFVSGITYINSLQTNNLIAESLSCEGFVNTYNFTDIAADTARRGNNITLKGHKHFINLTVDNLIVDKGMDLAAMRHNEKEIFTVEGETAKLLNTHVENIHFHGSCNGIDSLHFENLWKLHDGDIFNGDVTFDKVSVNGNLLVDSGHINHVNLTEFAQNTVKTDEPFHFNSATFSKYWCKFWLLF